MKTYQKHPVNKIAVYSALIIMVSCHSCATVTSKDNARYSTKEDKIENIITMFSSNSWRVREEALKDAICLGSDIAPALEKRLEVTTDANERYYIERVLSHPAIFVSSRIWRLGKCSSPTEVKRICQELESACSASKYHFMALMEGVLNTDEINLSGNISFDSCTSTSSWFWGMHYDGQSTRCLIGPRWRVGEIINFVLYDIWSSGDLLYTREDFSVLPENLRLVKIYDLWKQWWNENRDYLYIKELEESFFDIRKDKEAAKNRVPIDPITRKALTPEQLEESRLVEDAIEELCCKSETPLHKAARTGNKNAVEQILSQQNSVLLTDFFGRTPLHMAAQSGNEDIVGLLIGAGAEVNCKDKGGFTPLHDAAFFGSTNVVKLLINSGADVNAAAESGFTPLHLSAFEYEKEIAHALIEKGSKLSAVTSNFFTPLRLCVLRENIAIAELFISNGADINEIDNEGLSLLHLAIHKGPQNGYTIDLLVKNGVNINMKDSQGRTPLHMAAGASNGDFEITRFLINNGADINVKDNNGATPLHYAPRGLNLNTLELLLAKGIGVNETDANGRTAVHKAAMENRQTKAKFLIEKGADINAKDNTGSTPMHYAAAHKYGNGTLSLLIAKGGDVNSKNLTGETPLDIALKRENNKNAELLRDHGGVSGPELKR